MPRCSNTDCSYPNPSRTTPKNNIPCGGKINGVKCTGTYNVTASQAAKTKQKHQAIYVASKSTASGNTGTNQ
jgi:hypothetical protein